MSEIDESLKKNRLFSQQFRWSELPTPPQRKMAILTCMDCRLLVGAILGIQIGDAHVIRNAGGIATEDALRSIVISHHLLGVREVMIIQHTDCGLQSFRDEEFRAQLERETGKLSAVPQTFYAFTDLEDNVLRQIRRIKTHVWLAERVSVRGFIYDVTTGRLREVVDSD